MASKEEELLSALWADNNLCMNDGFIDSTISASERRPDDPFGDIGGIFKQLLERGATRRDLALIFRYGCYDGAFTTLFRIAELSLDRIELISLYESLLSADPSGREGSPGSAPPMKPKEID